jgi:hypothetical protein
MISITIQRDGVPFADVYVVPVSRGLIDEYAVTVWSSSLEEQSVRVPAVVVTHDRADGPWRLIMDATLAAEKAMTEREDKQ